MALTLPCRACGKPVNVPVLNTPLCCECGERTPIAWFKGPLCFDYFRLWLIKTGRVLDAGERQAR